MFANDTYKYLEVEKSSGKLLMKEKKFEPKQVHNLWTVSQHISAYSFIQDPFLKPSKNQYSMIILANPNYMIMNNLQEEF